jgi:C4-dicarboxylate transporter, DcuC family
MTLLLGLLIIGAAVYAVLRKVDVRLALPVAAMALGTLAGLLPPEGVKGPVGPAPVLQKLFATFADPKFVIPICTAMGFAYVLRHTLCDQHLIHLLTEPLRRVRFFVIPGAVLVGFLVNVPIISQTSAAVAIGSVLVPLMLNARVSRVTAGAALVLGASIGGELLNPAAPEYASVVSGIQALGIPAPTAQQMPRITLPLDLLHLVVATTLFWVISLRAERARTDEQARAEAMEAAAPETSLFKVSLFKAAIPLVPLALLFLVTKPFGPIDVPESWLLGPKDPHGDAGRELFSARLIGSAMLVGVVVAALADRRMALSVAGAFFEGAGYAFTHIISIIVAAACFGEGVRQIGLDRVISQAIAAWPGLLLPAAGFVPLALAALSGSGMAATQSVFEFFAGPALALKVDPAHVGAVVSLGAAAGRTMSPVAAVVLMAASLTETNPVDLVKRVALPLLAGITVVVIVGTILATTGAWQVRG